MTRLHFTDWMCFNTLTNASILFIIIIMYVGGAGGPMSYLAAVNVMAKGQLLGVRSLLPPWVL